MVTSVGWEVASQAPRGGETCAHGRHQCGGVTWGPGSRQWCSSRDIHSNLWLLSLGSDTYVPRDMHRDVHSHAVLGSHDQEATLLSLDRKMVHAQTQQ